MGRWLDAETFETANWRYIEARHYGALRTGPVRGEVIHAPVTPEGQDTAIAVARFFQSGKTKGSTHTTVDGGTNGDNVIQSVKDSYVAHGAAGANHDRLHVEIAGMPDQTRAQWLDDYSKTAMEHGASVTAQHALKYGFPIHRIGSRELRLNAKGICGHADVRDAWGLTDHWDPGPHFPWDFFIPACQRWHHFWLSKHPGFNPAPDEPDFRVVVIASSDPGADVDEGMGRVYAKHNGLKFMEWPFTSVSFGAAIVIGAAREYADEIEAASMSGKVHVLWGKGRDETASKVAAEIGKGRRTLKGFPY